MAVGATPPVEGLRRGLTFAFAPIQGALSGATREATSFLGAFADVERLRAQAQQLQQQNDQLRGEQAQDEAIRAQNEQLAALLQVRSQLAYTLVTGTVIARGTAPNERVMTLDVGSGRGIAVGDPVVGPGATLMGRVTEVGADYSQVMLLDDPRLTVVGMTQVARSTGIVQGQLAGTLAMTQIASTDTVTAGEEVVTAGLSLGECVRSPYPKGLVIGRVVEVEKDPSAIVQTALLEPAVALDKLEYALVITDYQGGLLDGGAACATPAPSSSAGAAGASATPTRRPARSATPKPSSTPTPGLVLPSPSLGAGG
ncbi:MAG TPA: rod shape-determining protein MreC [Candidatus Limnocylindrales bacterium]|nr:rod shape-determining protein MreC [Candidatus Limnocylindrales bacterium]